MREAIRFAVERTTPTATTWWFGPVAGCVGAWLLSVMGVPVTFSEFIPNGILKSAFEVLVCVVVAYVLLFLSCLAIAPIHFRLRPYGGIRTYLKRRGVRQMWPQYAMAFGGAIFFIGFVGFLQINVNPLPQLPILPEAEPKPAHQEIEPQSPGQVETGRLVSQAQFAKISEIESFFGGKDESGLRQVFDIPNILRKNIDTQLVRMNFTKSGRDKDFFYTNYSDNGTVIFWAKADHFSIGPSGVHVEAGPKDVLFLVTTSKFQDAQSKLIGLLNSALVPDSIKVPLAAFQDVINKITELMMSILDERMHEDENYFIHNMDMGTPSYGVIVSDFARKTPHLKPQADLVLAAISASWKISR
jgi:hypothetical protein